LRHRVIDRLSVALVTGESDFNRGEVERMHGTMLKEVGVRTRVWVVPNLGHGVPGSGAVAAIHDWLDAAVDDRRKLATQFPASCIKGDAAPTREQWADQLFAEAELRLKKRESSYRGLMQLKGLMERWPDVSAARLARRRLVSFSEPGKKTTSPNKDDS
jgi:hypothetical protein